MVKKYLAERRFARLEVEVGRVEGSASVISDTKPTNIVYFTDLSIE